MNQSTKLKEQFDGDKDGVLDAGERKAARAWLQQNRPQRGRRGPGGGPGFAPGGEGARADGAPKQGMRIAPDDVPNHAGRGVFDPDIVRTYFVELPADDWYDELTAFHRTDVEVPATVTIDGTVYRDVGVQFRGNTSFMMAPGRKKSLDLTFDLVDKKQNLQGLRNLDLLNCNDDPSSLREMLHGWLANQFMPAPRVALARVVINGEDFGVYAGVQQFDREFVADHFGTKQGDRFKVPPDFSGNGGLRFLGDDPAAYRRNYELKSAESAAAWQGLVDACAALEHAPSDRLEAILPQHLDVEGMLWFLAIDNAIGDADGYYSRASDYLLYRDPKGRFHAIARDNNEILLGARGRGPGGPSGPAGPGGALGGGGQPGPGGPGGERRPEGAPPVAGIPGGQNPGGQDPGGPGGPGGAGGMRRGPGGPGGGTATSPLQGANRADRPLLHRLLEVPAWKQRYLANLRAIATTALNEGTLAPRLQQWRALFEPLVKVDAHSLYGYEAFANSFAVDDQGKPAPRSLLAIVAQRRKAILDDPSLQGSWPELAAPHATAQPQDGDFVLSVSCQASGAKIGGVRLYAAPGSFGAYTPIEMIDDGKHGDGAADDGVFGASLPPVAAGASWRYWLEATDADSGHVDCQPPGNGALPLVWRAPAAAKQAKKKG